MNSKGVGESCIQEGMNGYTCTCKHPPCKQQQTHVMSGM